MNLQGFTELQKQALLDLLVLGMYSDRHLASAEDDRLERLLASFQFPTDYARQQFVDASFTRVRQRPITAEGVRAFVGELAALFPDQATRLLAVEALENLLASDQRVTEEETRFGAVVKEVFGV